MVKKIECEICGNKLKGKEGLAAHKKAKHPNVKKKSKVSKNKLIGWGIFILIFALFSWFLIWAFSSAGTTGNLDPTQMNIVSHQNVAYHIHPTVEIFVDGTEIALPANIGVAPGIMRPLHTHDSTGEIHVEGPAKMDFTVGDFFDVWGRTFNQTCIFDNCVTEESEELLMYVNGEINTEYGEYVMKDHDNIRIEFISN